MKKHMYTAPTHFDVAPYKTLWQVTKDDGIEIYMQISQDESSPRWSRLGDVLEKAFSAFICDEKFSEMCLRLYERS